MANFFASKIFLSPLLLLALYTENAYAYLDPGTGSLLLQGLLGGIAGVAVFIKIYWHAVLAWFSSSKSKKNNKNDH